MKKFLFSVNVYVCIPMMLFMIKMVFLFGVNVCVFITMMLFMVNVYIFITIILFMVKNSKYWVFM